MFVSVVVCTHSLNNYQNLVETVNSLLEQTYREMETIIVVDGNERLHEKVLADYGRQPAIKTVLLQENMGLSRARNAGIMKARGDAIAFTDDDAVAEKGWLANIVATYQEFDAMAVGGKILPIWVGKKTDYLPEELYWLVGITHQGFAAEKVIEVRNTWGPNMSFKREVFEKVGTFNENLGFAKRGTSYIQAEEPELAVRMRRELGKGVMYNPRAIVYHKIPASKLKVRILLKRAFYQGYSKALLRKLNPSADAIATERSFLQTLLLKSIPQRMKKIYHLSELKELSFLVAVIISVGLGFAYGYMKSG